MYKNVARHIMAASIAVALFLPAHSASAADQKYLSDSSFTIDRNVDGVPVYVTSRLPVDDLINRHIASWKPGTPLRFAHPYEVALTTQSLGNWAKGNDGFDTWTARFRVPSAVSINLGFKHYVMPEGGTLTMYSADRSDKIRAFTSEDNSSHGQLWTPMLDGEEILVEVRVPTKRRDSLELEIGSINAGFTDFNNPFAVLSGSCNIDVVCAQGDAWREQIRSVGAYTRAGVDYCSGALVNNARNDGKSYFLTAFHCGVTTSTQASVVIYWNYQNSTCRAPGSPASGGPGNGSRAEFSTGVIVRGSNSATDFTLVETQTPVSPSFDLYWSGVDATTNLANGAVGIHHPRVEEKRISFANDPMTVTTYLGTTSPGNGTHLRVFTWQQGTTEGGSSGSPIFNPSNKRIIGQLHGGYAACGDPRSDWYGWTNVSWLGGGTAATQLKAWLDPDNTGALSFDGFGGAPFTMTVAPTQIGICAASGSTNVAIDVGAVGTFAGSVALTATGAPSGSTTSFTPAAVTAPGTSTLTVGNLAAATAGVYSLAVTGTSGADSITRTIPFVLSSADPTTPSLTAPANGATGVSSSPLLTWAATAGSLNYRVEVSTSATFATLLVDQIVTGTTYTPTTPLAGATVYYWRVTAQNNCGDAPVSTVYSFRTISAPGQCEETAVETTRFTDDMESGVNGWTTTGSTGASTWVRSTARANSGTNSWYAVNLGAVSDQRLISPAITLPANESPLTLSFANWRLIEQSTAGCFDGGLLEVSTNGGTSFTQVPASKIIAGGTYRGVISGEYGNPLAGSQGWCNDPARPFTDGPVRVDLSDYSGQVINLRFRLGTDSSVSKEGWYVDDVKVTSCAVSGDDDIIFADGFEISTP